MPGRSVPLNKFAGPPAPASTPPGKKAALADPGALTGDPSGALGEGGGQSSSANAASGSQFTAPVTSTSGDVYADQRAERGGGAVLNLSGGSGGWLPWIIAALLILGGLALLFFR